MTPSERAQALINPNLRTRSAMPGQMPIVAFFKALLGTPAPWLLTLAIAATGFGEHLFTLSIMTFSFLTVGYIFVDRLSRWREFSWRWTPSDVMLIILIAVVFSAQFKKPLDDWPSAFSPFVVLVVTYGLDLFPGLNRRFWWWLWITPLAAAFVLWQRLLGFTSDLSFLPSEWAERVSGLRTAGFFESSANFTIVFASAIGFLTATFLLIQSRRATLIKYLALVGLSLCWLALVTLESMTAMMAGLIAAMLILLYFQRSFLLVLVLLFGLFNFLPTTHYFSALSRVSYWLEKGPMITEQKRQLAQKQVKVYYNDPVLGEGLNEDLPEAVTSNFYLDWLRATGTVGFLAFMLTALTFLLKSHQLLQEVPNSHSWHKIFVAGLLSSQVTFLTLCLFHSPLRSPFSMLWLALIWGLIHYMDGCYRQRLVPDDHSI